MAQSYSWFRWNEAFLEMPSTLQTRSPGDNHSVNPSSTSEMSPLSLESSSVLTNALVPPRLEDHVAVSGSDTALRRGGLVLLSTREESPEQSWVPSQRHSLGGHHLSQTQGS